MAKARSRQYTTGTRREVTPEWISSVRGALKQRDRGLRWLETEAGLAKGAATKILEGKQQTSNHVDAISKVLGLSVPSVAAEAPDEAKLLAIYRGMTTAGRAHLLGFLELVRLPDDDD